MNETLYSKIKEIDLSSLGKCVIEDEFRGYFLEDAGKEHYKLLAAFSTMYDNSNLLDIGTYKGCSSLALSYNKTNQIKSFDLIDHRKLSSYPENVEYIIGDFTNNKYKELVISSPFIMLDTFHDGIFENYAYKYLKSLNWKGYLLLDDINLNNEMKEFWKSIEIEKHEITSYGHWSGTGLVVFK